MRTTLALAVAVALVVCTLSFAVDYVWTGGGDSTTWAAAANWGAADYPRLNTDTATIDIDNGDADINTPAAGLTIGDLMTTGLFDEKIVCGGTVTIDGHMTISNGTFECNGYALSVVSNVYLYATLDAYDGEAPDAGPSVSMHFLQIYTGGKYDGTSGTNTMSDASGEEWWGNDVGPAGFIHNSGTVKYDGTGQIRGLETVFNKLIVNADNIELRGPQLTFESGITVNDSHYCLANYWATPVYTFGTSTSSGYIDGGSGTRALRVHDCGLADGKSATFQAANKGYPLLITGDNDWDWSYVGVPQHIKFKWADVRFNIDTDGDGNKISLVGDCTFTNITLQALDAFDVGAYGATTHDLTIDANGTNTVSTGTNALTGNFANSGTFACGAGTMIFTNSVSVDNNGQPFYNLTVNAGAGNTVTLSSGGQVSAISNLLHVSSGTCHTDDKIDSPSISGTGEWDLLGGGVDVIACGVNPQVDAGAKLETGNEPPHGSVVIIR